ncbi:MAG: hypothetical protein H6587_09995 [Flavobacteriales bacterium]|nr:hypothetical protein [Flavobacteriales bacterium]
MKTQNKFIMTLLICASTLIISCSKDSSTGGGTATATSNLTFNFTHNFDGVNVSATNFNQFDFINLNGDTLNLTKLRYLISDIRLFKANGDSILIDDYLLVDVTNSTGLTFSPTDAIPTGSYTDISFTFGFDSLDNLVNYPDLNSANWNWPPNIGGGYHFMQMEGKYKDLGNEIGYAYHMGTASPSSGVFEANHFRADLGAINITGDATIEIKMDIAEWYKNPNTWDLNDMHNMLMPNYNAQIKMNQNGRSVFSLGTVTQ